MKSKTLICCTALAVICLIFCNRAFAQPGSGLKINKYYKYMGPLGSYLNDRNFRVNINENIYQGCTEDTGFYNVTGKLRVVNDSLIKLGKDTLNLKSRQHCYTLTLIKKIYPDSLRKLDTKMLAGKREIQKSDSVLQILQNLLNDTTTAVGKKLQDSATVSKIKESRDSLKSKLDTLRQQFQQDSGRHSTMHHNLLSLMDSTTAYPKRWMGASWTKERRFGKVRDLTVDITQKIKALRHHNFQGRIYTSSYLEFQDTAKARLDVKIIQDSIDRLVMQRTSIREYRKLTRNFTFFPAISQRSAKYFFGDVSQTDNSTVDSSNFYAFQNLGVFYTNNSSANTTVYAQLAAAYAGPVKAEINTYISLPKGDSGVDAKKVNAMSALAGGGGNATLQLQFPLLALNVNKSTFGDLHFSSIFNPRFAVDIPSSSDTTNNGKYSSYTSAGITNKLSFTLEKRLQLSGEFSYSSVWANSLFMDKVGLTGTDRKRFTFCSYTIGVQLNSSFAIRYTTYTTSNSLKLNNVLTFTLATK